jgi:glycosyltransferase involved in cell wall biosynthesis
MKLLYEGPFYANSSLAIINRNLCGYFLKHCELQIIPTDSAKAGKASLGKDLQDAVISSEEYSSSQKADVYIRHKWPPDFSRPDVRSFVHYQPWEFGALPAAWVASLCKNADRVWVYSQFTKKCFIENGIPESALDIVPPGLDPDVFHPQAKPDKKLSKDRRFKFLYVGGTIFRKGIDILLNAYAGSFAFRMDVLLVIKDYPCNAVYENANFAGIISKLKNFKGMPAIEYITEDLTDEQMAGLYASCDCLVAPYRAEGFGMPILEALACGCPAVVTDFGAALDFCSEGPCRMIKAVVKGSDEKKILGLDTAITPFWAEADVDTLAEAMDRLREDPVQIREKAKKYSADILKNYSWNNVAEKAMEKIKNCISSST